MNNLPTTVSCHPRSMKEMLPVYSFLSLSGLFISVPLLLLTYGMAQGAGLRFLFILSVMAFAVPVLIFGALVISHVSVTRPRWGVSEGRVMMDGEPLDPGCARQRRAARQRCPLAQRRGADENARRHRSPGSSLFDKSDDAATRRWRAHPWLMPETYTHRKQKWGHITILVSATTAAVRQLFILRQRVVAIAVQNVTAEPAIRVNI
jgi:hypothetical protein